MSSVVASPQRTFARRLIGIARVRRRVVESPLDPHDRPFGQPNRLAEIIRVLAVEVPVVDFDQRASPAVREIDERPELASEQVHVGRHRLELDVHRDLEIRSHHDVGSTGRKGERVGRWRCREPLERLPDWGFGEIQAHPRAIGLAVCQTGGNAPA